MTAYLDRQTFKRDTGRTYYKYLVACPVCEEQRWQYLTYPTRCKSCAGKTSYTLPTKDRKDKRQHGNGYITKQGYHLLFDGSNYIPAHRIAFPNLPNGHVVHHIDGNKLNNDISNLLPLSKSAHRALHGQLENVSYKLIQLGFIEFDQINQKYILSTLGYKLINDGFNISQENFDLYEKEVNLHIKAGRYNQYPIPDYAKINPVIPT